MKAWPLRVVLPIVAAGALALLAASWALRGRDGPAPPAGPGPRIAAMSPGIAVMLRDLGLADRVVGRHAFDLVLPKSVPPCGDEAAIDYERLVSVRPTHVLIQQSARGVPDRLRTLAERSGWQVVEYPLLTLDDVRACFADLGKRFGAGPAAASLERRWSEAMSPRGDLSSAGRVLLLAGVGPPSAPGPGSWHHQILARIGGTPAISEGAAWITLDAEDVLRIEPDAIILILPRAPGAAPTPSPSREAIVAMLERVGKLDIPAVRSGRVALIDDPLAHTPSSAMIGVADRLAEILARWTR